MDVEKYQKLKRLTTELYEELKQCNGGPIDEIIQVDELERHKAYYMAYLALDELICCEF